MAQDPKERRIFRLEQIEQAQKLLRTLPEKDTRKTRQEAIEFLKEDFHKALGKGYSPKELSAFLKGDKVNIPVQLIEDAVRQEKTDNTAAKPSRKRKKAHDKRAHKPLPQAKEEETVTGGGFEVTPDIPDEEL